MMNSEEILERKKIKDHTNTMQNDYSDFVISAYIYIIAIGPRSAAP